MVLPHLHGKDAVEETFEVDRVYARHGPNWLRLDLIRSHLRQRPAGIRGRWPVSQGADAEEKSNRAQDQ
jgi:hypothetical protein